MGELVGGTWTWWWTTAAVTVIAAAVLDVSIRKAHGWARVVVLGEARRAMLPPGNMGWPVIGNMLTFLWAFKSGKPDSFIESFHRRFGGVGLYRAFMFSNPTIVVTTPEACKQVLMDDQGFMYGWPEATVKLIGTKSFVIIAHEEHKRLRKLTASPINGADALNTYLGLMNHHASSSLRRWSETGEQIEFLTELCRMTFRILLQIFVSTADEPTMKKLERIYSHLHDGLRAMAVNVPGFAYHRALKARKKLVSILQGILEERRAGKVSSTMDMMDRLTKVEDEDGRKLEDDQIIDILIMYLAGHDSSAHVTMWATVFMQENPEVLERAKAEQEEVMKSIPPTQNGLNLKDFRRMEYLSQIIDETLRIANISFVAFREAKKDVVVNGYLIPKGWKVQLWYRSVHMNPKVYSDPGKFNPSRWEGSRPKAGSFLAFGLGRNMCPGNDLAKLEISVFLHHFLLGYKGSSNYVQTLRAIVGEEVY